MPGYVALAILNGMALGMVRVINARLSMEVGPFRASFWNHAVGFLFLTVVLFIVEGGAVPVAHGVPTLAYLGGAFGALFVAANSYILPRIGAVRTVLLVVSGQMVSSVIIDYQHGSVASLPGKALGVFIVLIGVCLAVTSRARPDEKNLD